VVICHFCLSIFKIAKTDYYILLKCAQITTELHIILNYLLYQLESDNFLAGKLVSYDTVLISVPCVALVCKAAAEEIIIMIFFLNKEAKVLHGP
jgi:hypothetical protein